MCSYRDSLNSVIATRYGPEIVRTVRDLGNYRKKMVRLKSSLNFLKKCRDNNIIPSCVRITPRYDIAHSAVILSSASVRLLKLLIRNKYSELNLINSALYKLHCECGAVLSYDDFNLCDKITYLQAERVYDLCNVTHERKLERLIARQHRNTVIQNTDVTDVINLSSMALDDATQSVLKKGLNFATTPNKIPYEKVISSVEEALICNKVPPSDSDTLRQDVAVVLRKAKLPTSNITVEERAALKNIRNNTGVHVLKADKGNATVVIDAEDYDCKVRGLLSDTAVYKPVSYDPTARVTRRIRAVIRDNRGLFTEEDYDRLHRPSIVQSPKLYGLPKVHKAGVPLRPIVSQINSPTSKLAKYMASVLKPLVGNTSSFVKDSRHFIAIIKDITLEPDELMVSFDVESLFTNVPIGECVDLIRGKFKEHSMPDGFISLLRNCLEGNYLVYRGQHYLQIDGVAMGSPVAPILANIWMEHIETLLPRTRIKVWKRYVDDVFCIFKGNKPEVEQFLKLLNSIHPRIQFTYELEMNRSLAFLDVKVMARSDGSLSHTVYRKPTHTDKYLNALSHHHPRHLRSVATSLINRAHALCDPEHLEEELAHVQEVLKKNGYRIGKTHSGHKPRVKQQEVLRKPAFLPYVRGVTDKIGSLLKEYSIKTIYTPLSKVSEQVGTPKDSIPYQTPGVYKIDCSCGSSYIGQTKRTIAERVKEHIAAVKNRQVEKSAVAEHLLESGTNHWIELHRPKVLSNERHYFSRLVREAVEIKKHKNFNRESGFKLSPAWNPVISKCTHREVKCRTPSDVVSVVCRGP